MKAVSYQALIACLLLTLTLIGCTDPSQTEPAHKDKQPMNTSTNANTPVSISLFEPVTSWQAKFPKMQINKQPAGLNFYSADFETMLKHPVTLRFEFGRHSFSIPAVLGVMGTEDIDFPTEHIADLLISSGLTEGKEEMHDQARQAFFKLLDDIVKAGWKPYLYTTYPRLTAKEILRRVIKKDLDAALNLRPEYKPTLEEWMQLPDDISWNFHANHIRLEIALSHDITKRDPQKPGAYFMSITIRPMTHAMQDGMKPEERRDWRAVQAKLQPKYQAIRAEAEAKEKAAGHQIDTDYQDPPMPPEH
ncbi:hypothetical protein HNQ59_003305 [Chitinivorax tropicus]|uniref:Lipoprotein n=1 Tax=Chitinivorax tropicus TaxID=714531 RepID=A0A840MS73_9PROT|nr:hypothetical protein [Chitinivorax tropicus]MBB5019997.1 hypothetical protein [Chitinivorax tropicus]